VQAAQLQKWWQLTECNCAIATPRDINTAHMLAVLAKVHQHTIHLLLSGQLCCDAVQCHHSCLVQPAVRPGGTKKQAALVVGC
jgi:hypothetical protein